MIADSQSSSQIGDISKFMNMDLISATEREARISLRNNEDGLVMISEKLKTLCNSKSVVLKLGAEGVLVHAGNNSHEKIVTDRISALNSYPRDVAGAGDSMLIVSGMVIASNGNIWEAICLGSIASAIQVGRVGNSPLNSQEMLAYIE